MIPATPCAGKAHLFMPMQASGLDEGYPPTLAARAAALCRPCPLTGPQGACVAAVDPERGGFTGVAGGVLWRVGVETPIVIPKPPNRGVPVGAPLWVTDEHAAYARAKTEEGRAAHRAGERLYQQLRHAARRARLAAKSAEGMLSTVTQGASRDRKEAG